MKQLILNMACASILVTSVAARGAKPNELGASPQEMGSAGVVWYATWESALAEAKRSQRPIFFMAAAAQCSGISGVF